MQRFFQSGSSVDRGGGSIEIENLVANEPSSRRDPIRWLIGCGIVLIVAIVAGTAIMVSNFRDRAITNSERELENAVQLLARHFDQELEDFKVVQNVLAAKVQDIRSAGDFRQRMSTYEMHLSLQARLEGATDATGINIYDADGLLANSSEMYPTPAISIADRQYFRALKAAPSETLGVELLRSRVTGKMAILIARKLTGASGEFLGVTTRGFSPEKFESFFSSIALGKDATVSLHHRDGTLLARYPHVEEAIGTNFRKGTSPGTRLLDSGHGTAQLVSPVDGRERLAAVQSLSRFPLTIAATTTVASALSDWRAQTKFIAVAASLSAIIIAITLALIVVRLTRQHRASRLQLALEQRRLYTAINNMPQSLLLYDAQERLIVCNQRYIDMFELSPDIVKPGRTFRELLIHHRDRGSLPGDIDLYCAHVRSLLQQGMPSQNTYQTKDGRSIQVAYQPLEDGGWVTTLEDVTERSCAEERIAHLAHYDALTDLPNRVLFRERLGHELDRNAQCAILYIDIDEFKSVNDSLGHPVGDELLKTLAARLQDCIGVSDLVARLGGDEFAIVRTGTPDREAVNALVDRVYHAIRLPCDCLGHQITTDASIGIALAPSHGTDLDQLLKHADLAMYAAKAGGRRIHRFFEPEMDAVVKKRQQLEQDLRQIITSGRFTEGGFEIHYQPLVNLQTNSVSGCEALLRWKHARHGMISPAEFIPVAEDTGLISQLGDWVLATACQEAANWPCSVRLAINVSPVQFRSPTLGLHVVAALASSGMKPSRLELEITEAVLIRDDDGALATLQQLRAIGVRTALDDFGTGYSSLSYLQRFPFDKIKIDRCFVKDVAQCDGSASIVQAVVNIAASRAMTTTAEGVETEAQRETLRALGCTEIQGWLFSPARPAAEIRQILNMQPNKAAAR
jgi:diguanylate cyclase (GGDEF)-like protein